jgi:hypothetical protein
MPSSALTKPPLRVTCRAQRVAKVAEKCRSANTDTRTVKRIIPEPPPNCARQRATLRSARL